MEDVCGERRCPGGGEGGGGGGGGECVWGENDIARPRIECLFLSVEVVSDEGAGMGGGGEGHGDGWERHRERQQRQRVARLAVEVNGSCFAQGV
jgi:hypothetical protein